LKRRNLQIEVRTALGKTTQTQALASAFNRMRSKRMQAMPEISLPELLELKSLRRRSAQNMDSNIELLRRVVEEAGGGFHLARTAEEARRYICDILRKRGAKLVVKTKSMTTEEINLNRAILGMGVKVVETDLGERIVQLAGERPTHILAPAVHKNVAEIAALFSPSLRPETQEITRFVRGQLRESFRSADVGITGANVISAHECTVFIVTNEGNDMFVTSLPPVYICVAGVEKVVSSIEEALRVIEVLVPSATGHRMSSYVTVLSPLSERFAKGREFHLILLDNGRRGAVGGVFSEALECIRCAACLNICPTYRLVGGHVFGDIYTGPIGLPWTAITAGTREAYEFSSLCVSCGLCKAECPVDIDIPHMISQIKNEGNGRWGQTAPWLLRKYEKLIRLGAKAPHVSNLLVRSRLGAWVLERLAGIDRRRPLPSFASTSLDKLLPNQPASGVAESVALFTDALIMYMFPEIGLEAASVLKAFGVSAFLPQQLSSGMPLIQCGYLHEASRTARENVARLSEYVERGHEVVCLEPTAWYCVREVYPKLLGRAAETLAEHAHSFSEYLLSRMNRYSGPKRQSEHLAYHWPCHARGAEGGPAAVRLLSKLGFEVSFVDEGCCGMAGTWGMRKGFEGYEMSRRIGENLASALSKTGAGTVVTDSTVCMLQLQQFSRLRITHLSTILSSLRKPS